MPRFCFVGHLCTIADMKLLISFLLLFLSGSAVSAQQPPASSLADRIDLLAKAVLARPSAGMSIAIARDGKTIFARGYGSANLNHSVPVTPQTVFHIASISKNILAAVVLQLADQGMLQLDDDVTKYVPEAPTHGRRVTVGQLLSHTSGIYSFTSLPGADINERLDLSHEQVLGLIKDKPFDFEPGSLWRYNNSGFYLAGMVVERVTKQDYGAYVQQHVFKPLGMDTASMCDASMIVPHLSSGYERDGGTLVNAPFLSWKLPFAAGAICATPTDLLKWQDALDSGRVLKPSSLKLMRSPTILEDGTVVDYGLGTRLGSLEGHKVIGHTGGGGGFNGVLENFPDDHLTIVVLINTGSGADAALAISTAIARPLLGLPEKRSLLDLPVPKEEIAALVGKYDSDDGPVEIFEKEGKLHFRIPGTTIEGIQQRQAANVYSVNENTEIHVVIAGAHAGKAIVYTGGLFMDLKTPVR